jgi:polyisoprenyl-phosphate glycosyltransferase
MKEKPYISLIAYNHYGNGEVSRFVKSVDKFLDTKFENYEIILVNADGQEGSDKNLSKLGKEVRGKLISINMAWKQNKELAMLAGTDFAIGDFVFEIESVDIDYDLNLLYELYKKCVSGYDLVTASPDCKNISSSFFYKILGKFSSLNFDLNTETVKIISRRGLNAALKYKEKIRYRKVLYRNLGLPFSEICYTSKSNKPIIRETFAERVSLGMEVLLSYSEIGLRLSFFFSVFFLLFSIAVSIYTLYVYLTQRGVVTGWTTTMLFLSFAFSGVFLLMAIIGKYLTMVLQEVKQAPPYVVKSVNRINS